MIKMKKIKRRMIIGWLCFVFGPFISLLILAWMDFSKNQWLLILYLVPLPFLALAIYFTAVYNKAKKAQLAQPAGNNTPVNAAQNAPKKAAPQPKSEKYDSLMSGQLVAMYKKDFDKAYMNEYVRRLMHIGFSEGEANNLFMYESMNMKSDSVSLLQHPS